MINNPSVLFIEMNNTCNIRCKMCSLNNMKRKPLTMDTSVVKRLIDEAVEMGIPKVRLHFYGEPLINKDLIAMIKYCKERGISLVHLTSNATMLSAKLSKELILSGLDEIYFSMTGTNQEVYERFQGYDGKYTLAEVEKNIEELVNIRQSMHYEKPIVALQYIFDGKDLGDCVSYLDRWEGKVERFNFTHLVEHGIKGKVKLENYRRCDMFDTMLAILSNGEATVCCSDIEGVLSLGNISDNSLIDLWQGVRMNKMRQQFAVGNPSEIPPICQVCDNVINGMGCTILQDIWYRQASLNIAQQIADAGEKVILFGANDMSTNILMHTEAFDNIEAIVDSHKQGQIRGKKIYPVNYLKSCGDARVVICSDKYGAEMMKAVVEQGGENLIILARLDEELQRIKKQYGRE
jgi:MoaA/NifB/PqqE/SkfB family radical SAM enzyme